jgi:ferredoxin-NADP reductase
MAVAAAAVARRRLAPGIVCGHAGGPPLLRLWELRRHISSSQAAATEHGRPDHMELTSEQERGSTLAGATIRKLSQLSPTVVGLELVVDDHELDESPPFRFAAGQWVDFHIPDVDTIGGYSITSLPEDLPVLELAVKASDHPPAAWVTREAKVGDRVHMRVGGEFVYAAPAPVPTDRVQRLLFIAGGVGINPLYGMIRQLHRDVQPVTPASVVLLYSAGMVEELVFRPELDDIALPAKPESTSDSIEDNGLTFRVIYTVTQSGQRQSGDVEPAVRTGRINSDTVGEAIGWLAAGSPSTELDGVYVCGPPGMAEQMVDLCAQHAVPPEKVQFESWW